VYRRGGEVVPFVTKATTLLIVGDQDIGRLAGHEKSSKHRKAEKLIEKGRQFAFFVKSIFGQLFHPLADQRQQKTR